jgi:predicted aminopeptidase
MAALLIATVILAALQTGGCYYMQAVNGQLEVLRKREPIVDVLEDAAMPEATRERLAMVLEARQFAVDELKLPDNDSYRSYADLHRDYVVWNVFAAPEFSLEPKTWCFLVVGCVAYRGYFSEQAANKHADRLHEQGFDVFVSGVPAYSTLGRFDDPVLNTMMRWSDADLVSTLFHELAHQKLFIKGDTGFNESFATAVAEVGLERWLGAQGQGEVLSKFEARDTLRQALMAVAESAKDELRALYAETMDDAAKREKKRALLDGLSERAAAEAAQLGFSNAGWLRPPLNNARLASTSLYRGNLPAFRRLMVDCDEDITCFYREAARLAELPADDRQRELERAGLSSALTVSADR